MTCSRTLLALTAAAALGTGLASWSPAALAQASNAPPSASAPATPAPSAHRATVAPRSDAQINARIAQLHRELKITAAQDGQWNALAQIMRANAHDMADLIRARNAHARSMDAMANLQSYAQIADAHADGLKKLVPAFQSLYDSMSAAQKKNADKIFATRVTQRVRATTRPAPATKG